LGPLLDRIDIHMQVFQAEYQKQRDMRPGEFSAEVLKRVKEARERQGRAFKGTDIASNTDMRPAQVCKYCELDDPCTALMKTSK